MKEKDNLSGQYAAEQSHKHHEDSHRAGTPGQRYTLAVMGTQASTNQPVTISLEIVDEVITALSASDSESTYEVAFHLHKVKPGAPSSFNFNAANVDGAGAQDDHGGGHGNGNDDDECYMCVMQGGVVRCYVVPCPPE